MCYLIKKSAWIFHAHSTDLSVTPFTLSVTAAASISWRRIIIVLSVRDAVAVRVPAVDADVVTDAVTICIDKFHAAASGSTASASAVVIADSIVVVVHESRAITGVVTDSIVVVVHILGAVSAVTLTVLGGSNS